MRSILSASVDSKELGDLGLESWRIENHNAFAQERVSVAPARPRLSYLVAGHHRTGRGGPDADWSIELAPPPDVKPKSGASRAEAASFVHELVMLTGVKERVG